MSREANNSNNQQDRVRHHLILVQTLLESKHRNDEHTAVGGEGEPRVEHRDVAEPQQGPVLEHELVQEVPVGVEDGHHEPGPLQGAEERHVSLLGRAVAHADHLFENACLSRFLVVAVRMRGGGEGGVIFVFGAIVGKTKKTREGEHEHRAGRKRGQRRGNAHETRAQGERHGRETAGNGAHDRREDIQAAGGFG